MACEGELKGRFLPFRFTHLIPLSASPLVGTHPGHTCPTSPTGSYWALLTATGLYWGALLMVRSLPSL